MWALSCRVATRLAFFLQLEIELEIVQTTTSVSRTATITPATDSFRIQTLAVLTVLLRPNHTLRAT